MNRIKVIASDLDGTLLDDQHRVPAGNRAALKRATDFGIRFVVATGRDYQSARRILKECKFDMDFLVSSGSQIIDRNGKVCRQIYMDQTNFPEIYEILCRYPVAVRFCSNEGDYMIGTEEEVENYLIEESLHFFKNTTEEEIRESEEFRRRLDQVHHIDDILQLRTGNVGVYKIFLFSRNVPMLRELQKELEIFDNISIASSFVTNLELTHREAQKGIALEEFIQQEGYRMNEVMVLGDSLNDYSMMSRDFGARVAPANSMEEIKEAATHLTRSNDDSGVAYAINLMMSDRLDEIRKR